MVILGIYLKSLQIEWALVELREIDGMIMKVLDFNLGFVEF